MAHTPNISMPIVNQLFPNKVISRKGNISWRSRSPDLIPIDFYLWGYLKSIVYDINPKSIYASKENIRREIANISESICRAVINNFRVHLQEYCDRNGLNLDNVIFKKIIPIL